jgi:hypothetical protein
MTNLLRNRISIAAALALYLLMAKRSPLRACVLLGNR